MAKYIYLKYNDTLYKVGKGKCFSFDIGKTKKNRLKKNDFTPCRLASDIEISSKEEWKQNLQKYGY